MSLRYITASMSFCVTSETVAFSAEMRSSAVPPRKAMTSSNAANAMTIRARIEEKWNMRAMVILAPRETGGAKSQVCRLPMG